MKNKIIVFIDLHTGMLVDGQNIPLDFSMIEQLAKSLANKAAATRGIPQHKGYYFNASILGGQCTFHLGYKGTLFYWGGVGYDRYHVKDVFEQLNVSYEQIWKRKSSVELPNNIPVIMGYLTPQDMIKEMPEWLPGYLIHFGQALYENRVA